MSGSGFVEHAQRGNTSIVDAIQHMHAIYVRERRGILIRRATSMVACGGPRRVHIYSSILSAREHNAHASLQVLREQRVALGCILNQKFATRDACQPRRVAACTLNVRNTHWFVASLGCARGDRPRAD